MGAGEEATPTKSSKPASTMQEAPSTPAMPAYPDWSTSMQAFYGAGATPPFFASTVASPSPHPFLWGGQHPMMSPYGTPVPYPALYPPGGVYAHPNMVTAPGNVPGIHAPVNVHGTVESDAKAIDGKDRASSKKAKKAAGISGKTGDSGKATSGSGNEIGTQSAESRSEGSSDASDDNNQEFQTTKKGSFDQMLADGANANAQSNTIPSPVTGNPVASGPITNLNIGMDLWNTAPAGTGQMLMRPTAPGVSPSVNQSDYVSDQWIQDERELKRQKRKQSNRESARRSRLRKQAECEELQQRVEALTNENHTLRDELQRLSEECKKLGAENNSIKEELTKLCGRPDDV